MKKEDYKWKKKRFRLLITVICMLAAGICYSCGRYPSEDGAARGALVLELPEETTGGDWQETYREIQNSPGILDGAAAQPPSDNPVLYVHICGKICDPGVYEMKQGDRIFQVIECAGGFAEGAAEGFLNLALEVFDGMKIVVPARDELESWEIYGSEFGAVVELYQTMAKSGQTMAKSGQTMAGDQIFGDAAAAGQAKKKVNLNTASREELMTLRGIGESRAEDIIRYRAENGPFKSIEEIMNVSGIKDAAFQKIKDSITV